MHLKVPRLEITAEEAKAIMQREGEKKLIKHKRLPQTKLRTAHIWMDGYTSNMALTHFQPDRNPLGDWAERWGAKGWIGASARGWRTKDGDFTRVELIYIGEEAIEKEHQKAEAATQRLQGGFFRIYPYGVPKKPEYVETRKRLTIAQIASLNSPVDRFKALFTRYNYDIPTEPEEFKWLGLKFLMEPDHVVAIGSKGNLQTVVTEVYKEKTYKETTLADLKQVPAEGYEATLIYVLNEEKPTYGFASELIDKSVKAFYPRFIRDKHASKVKVIYPEEAAPMILRTDEHDAIIIVAPLFMT